MRLRPLFLVVSVSCLWSADAPAQNGGRSAELQKLDFYVGGWTESGQMRDDPAKPFLSISGGETCKWAAGGFAVICEEKTAGPGGGWEGVYILGYDPAAKKYHVHGIEKPGNSLHATGRLEGVRWIWTTDPAPDGSLVRYTFSPASEGRRSLVVEAGSGGKWAAIATVTYTARK